jgi:hypothetical protein
MSDLPNPLRCGTAPNGNPLYAPYPKDAPPPASPFWAAAWVCHYQHRTTDEYRTVRLSYDTQPLSHYSASSYVWRDMGDYEVTMEAEPITDAVRAEWESLAPKWAEG